MRRLTLAYSKKNSEPSHTLSSVPYKMLPIASLENYRVMRLERQIERLAAERPYAFEVLEKLVENLSVADDRTQAR